LVLKIVPVRGFAMLRPRPSHYHHLRARTAQLRLKFSMNAGV